MRNVVLVGDALEQLKTLPAESVHCCITSPLTKTAAVDVDVFSPRYWLKILQHVVRGIPVDVMQNLTGWNRAVRPFPQDLSIWTPASTSLNPVAQQAVLIKSSSHGANRQGVNRFSGLERSVIRTTDALRSLVPSRVTWLKRSRIRFVADCERVANQGLASGCAQTGLGAVTKAMQFGALDVLQLAADYARQFRTVLLHVSIVPRAGTTALVALKAGRDFIGIELSPAYAAMAERRIAPYRQRLL